MGKKHFTEEQIAFALRQADPFTLDRNMGSEWVRGFVLGSRPTPEDRKPLVFKSAGGGT
jgi:hypothetical protein